MERTAWSARLVMEPTILLIPSSLPIAVVNSAGTGFLSGHADGSIVRWYVAEDQAARAQGKIVVHSIPPYAMAWTSQHIAVAGPDKKVVFYTMDGMMAQQFDYFR